MTNAALGDYPLPYPLGSDPFIYDFLEATSAGAAEQLAAHYTELRQHPDQLIPEGEPTQAERNKLTDYLLASWLNDGKHVCRIQGVFTEVMEESLHREQLPASLLLNHTNTIYYQLPMRLTAHEHYLDGPGGYFLIHGALVTVIPLHKEDTLMVLIRLHLLVNGDFTTTDLSIRYPNLYMPIMLRAEPSESWEQDLIETLLLYAAYLNTPESDVMDGGVEPHTGVQFCDMGRNVANAVELETYQRVVALNAVLRESGQTDPDLQAAALMNTVFAPRPYGWECGEDGWQLRPHPDPAPVPAEVLADLARLQASSAQA